MAVVPIYIPIKSKLYNDIVRFSDGKVDIPFIVELQLENWLERDLVLGDGSNWGERFKDAARVYAPSALQKLDKNGEALDKFAGERKPLVWKEVTIAAGSDVRMTYGNTQHYATVRNGFIVDDDGSFSPSEWARKVAGNTSRNAWRDLWFRTPLSKDWVPAQALRTQPED